MTHGKVVEIDEVCNEIVDCLNRTAPKVEYETPYKMIRTSNVRNGRIDLEDVFHVDEPTYKKWTRRLTPKKGDIILTREAPLGEVGILKTNDKVFLGQRTVMYRANPDVCDNRFLFYSLIAPYCQAKIKAFGSGSTVEHMKVPDSKKIKLKLPPLPTQRKIAAILSAYDDLIENNLKRIKLLEEKAQLTYEEWFVRMKFPGHESTPINEETGLPEGWEKKKIGEACNISGGGTPSRTKDEFWKEGHISWFSPTDLTKANSIAVLDSSQKITELGLKKSSARLLEQNSFMMTSRATIGLFAVINKPFCTNQGFINITPYESIHKEYLLYNFITRIEEFKGYATGATFPELSKGKFKVLPINWPSKEVLTSFSNLISKIHSTLFSITNQNQLLKEARDILLPRLMTGMIEVNGLDLSVFEQGDKEEMLMAAEEAAGYNNK
ncbi:MAG: restriction endonuclease subunit S [Bacteroidota bacterium]